MKAFAIVSVLACFSVASYLAQQHVSGWQWFLIGGVVIACNTLKGWNA